METLAVKRPTVRLSYSGKDISKDVSLSLVDAVYVDALDGESDSIEIALEDVDKRWQGPWYPQHGDKLVAQLGYDGKPLLACGEFEVDEVELDGPPDVVRIKGLAAGLQRSVRTANVRSYENTTLGDIAATVARRNQLKLYGDIEHVAIGLINQAYETDLVFLSRLARDYGYSFSVRGKLLVFMRRSDIHGAKSVRTLTREDVKRFRYRDKILGVAASATVAYHDPATVTVKKATVQDKKAKKNRRSKDTIKKSVRVENDQQARLLADAALQSANEDQTIASLVTEGDIALVSGVNITLAGFGQMDGKYTIVQARHAISRASGYTTEIECKRVRDVEQGAQP